MAQVILSLLYFMFYCYNLTGSPAHHARTGSKKFRDAKSILSTLTGGLQDNMGYTSENDQDLETDIEQSRIRYGTDEVYQEHTFCLQQGESVQDF